MPTITIYLSQKSLDGLSAATPVGSTPMKTAAGLIRAGLESGTKPKGPTTKAEVEAKFAQQLSTVLGALTEGPMTQGDLSGLLGVDSGPILIHLQMRAKVVKASASSGQVFWGLPSSVKP